MPSKAMITKPIESKSYRRLKKTNIRLMPSKAMIAKTKEISNPKEDQKNQYPAYAFKSDDSQNKRFKS